MHIQSNTIRETPFVVCVVSDGKLSFKVFCIRAAILIKTVDFFCNTSTTTNNKDFLCPSGNFSGRKSSLDIYVLLAFGS